MKTNENMDRARRTQGRRPACLLLGLCLACLLAACGTRVDDSGWSYHRFEDVGIALRLPEDMAEERGRGMLFAAADEDVRLTVGGSDAVYADAAELAEDLGREKDAAAEVVTVNGAELVSLTGAEESAVRTWYGITPQGDTYCITLTVNEDAKGRRPAAVAERIAESICPADRVDAAAAVNHSSATKQPVRTDWLALANPKNALPDGWREGLDLVSMTNSRGEAVRAERTVCKAFFTLQRALAARGVSAEAGAGYRETPADTPEQAEHRTGLALDLYLLDGSGAELDESAAGYGALCAAAHGALADSGFILRYPEGGAYWTANAYDPLHIRYVGVEAAREIAARGITLEEYLGAEPAAVDYLVLVNAKNALPEGWEDVLETVHMANRHGEDVEVERVTWNAYLALRDALLEDGVHLDVNSAYRSVAAQEELVKSYTRKYGKDYVRQYVAVPGYSEHHTGLALDLYLESQDVWTKIHARLAEHGFILRYPEGKEAVTGYAYEPWHVRYVGVEAAEAITAQGLTLEEYLGAA